MSDDVVAKLRLYADELDGAGYAPEAVVFSDYQVTMRRAAKVIEELAQSCIVYHDDWHCCNACGAYNPTKLEHHAADCAVRLV